MPQDGAEEGRKAVERKYRQKGYMDAYQQEKREKREPPPKRGEGIGPRQPRMPGTRTVSRCAQCGTVLAALTEPLGQCSKCGFELHSCKQCAHFDTASRFECTQPIKERVAQKDARNDCQYFEIRTAVERDTSGGGVGAEDARKAFENLFKK